MEKAEQLEEYTPSELSKELDINPSTLRKYAGMIDEQNGGPFFERDKKNGRVYDKKAADLLKRVVVLKKAPDITLEMSIDMALLEYKQKNRAFETQSDTADITPKNEEITLLYDKIDFIGRQLHKLLEQNEQLIRDNQELKATLEQQQTLAEPREETTPDPEPIVKKPFFFSRLFKRKG